MPKVVELEIRDVSFRPEPLPFAFSALVRDRLSLTFDLLVLLPLYLITARALRYVSEYEFWMMALERF